MHRGKEANLSLLQGEGGPEEDVQQSVSFGSLLKVGGGEKVLLLPVFSLASVLGKWGVT